MGEAPPSPAPWRVLLWLEGMAVYIAPVAQVAASSAALLLTSHSKSHRHPIAGSSTLSHGAHIISPSQQGSAEDNGATYDYNTVVVNLVVELLKLVVCLGVWGFGLQHGKSWRQRWEAARKEVGAVAGLLVLCFVRASRRSAWPARLARRARGPARLAGVAGDAGAVVRAGGDVHAGEQRALPRVAVAAVAGDVRALRARGDRAGGGADAVRAAAAADARALGGGATAAQWRGELAAGDEFPVGAIALVLLCAAAAAAASIFCEHLFRRQFQLSLWLQNAQLYAAGIACNGAVLLVTLLFAGEGDESAAALRRNPFQGFDGEVLAIVAAYACLGLSVSGVVKLHSTVAKVYCAAISIFTTAYCSHIFLQFEMNLPFVMASATVCISLYLYYCDSVRNTPSSRPATAMGAARHREGEGVGWRWRGAGREPGGRGAQGGHTPASGRAHPHRQAGGLARPGRVAPLRPRRPRGGRCARGRSVLQ
eukprot:scaffold314_cov562-Prasinococcus_capsulatus_cf.AAC.2